MCRRRTVLILSGWVGARFPGVSWLSTRPGKGRTDAGDLGSLRGIVAHPKRGLGAGGACRPGVRGQCVYDGVPSGSPHRRRLLGQFLRRGMDEPGAGRPGLRRVRPALQRQQRQSDWSAIPCQHVHDGWTGLSSRRRRFHRQLRRCLEGLLRRGPQGKSHTGDAQGIPCETQQSGSGCYGRRIISPTTTPSSAAMATLLQAYWWT